MSVTRKTITVTNKQDQWIRAQVANGAFTNDSEYIRDLIRKDQARASEVEWTRRELLKGEQSGEPRPFDVTSFKNAMVSRHVQSEG